MSLSLASQTIHRADHLSIVRVQSSKCHYRVSFSKGEATLYGPGVEGETFDLEALGINDLPAEAAAIIIVLFFEER